MYEKRMDSAKPDPESRYLTVEEYAALIHRPARWVKDHLLPSCPPGKRLICTRYGREALFAPEDIAANKAKFTCVPADPQPQAAARTGGTDMVAARRNLMRLPAERRAAVADGGART
jgi:hypothetical protein